MNKIILFLTVFSFQFLYSQNPNFQSAQKIGNVAPEEVTSILSDINSNCYFTGSFFDTVDFDPGPSINKLWAPRGTRANFVLKMDSMGNLKWAKKFEGRTKNVTYCISTSMKIDQSGNVYITGYFNDTIDFDPGIDSFKLISQSFSQDIFVCKLDSSGRFVWAKQFAGSYFDKGYSLTLDDSANIYTTGSFQISVDFDPSANTQLLNTYGDFDIFVCKLDSSGNFIWAKQFGGPSNDIGYSLDWKNGYIFLTGTFRDTCDFDPGPGVNKLISSGKDDVFILKLNRSGDLIWVRQLGGKSDDIASSLKLDNFGNLFCLGGFSDTAEFNPSGISHKLISVGKMDIFLVNFDTSGRFKKVLGMGSDSEDISQNFAINNFGDIYITGGFQDTVDFDPGTGNSLLVSTGLEDVFITKIDSSGNHKWARKFGGTQSDIGAVITIDKSNNIITSGTFSSTVDFDPGPGVFNQTANGLRPDLYILKLKECSASFSTITLGGCDSLLLNNQTFYNSGIYTQVIPNVYGCDSTITLNLTINKSSSYYLMTTVCDSIILGNITFKSSGIYSYTKTNVAGCDSFITLNLTINKSYSKRIDLTACKTYTLNSVLYTASGTYYQFFKSISGCDSVITLNLTIIKLDSSVTQIGNTLTSNAIGAFYQWIDCNSTTWVIGATSKSFTPDFNGSYCVLVRTNACMDTSSCYNVTNIGIARTNQCNYFNIYPNPTKDKATIELNEEMKNATLTLYNSTGQIIFDQTSILRNNSTLDLSEINEGIYFMVINNNGKLFHSSVIKISSK